ncbi:hypothetical protein EDB85DRAFT_1893570 [Lactarius pseudohatsudake]|nr:hypothetical protein EDB85DRAFT_1893570 [Lactarius pseudohatsudake]
MGSIAKKKEEGTESVGNERVRYEAAQCEVRGQTQVTGDPRPRQKDRWRGARHRDEGGSCRESQRTYRDKDRFHYRGVPYYERSARAFQFAVKKLRKKRGITRAMGQLCSLRRVIVWCIVELYEASCGKVGAIEPRLFVVRAGRGYFDLEQLTWSENERAAEFENRLVPSVGTTLGLPRYCQRRVFVRIDAPSCEVWGYDSGCSVNSSFALGGTNNHDDPKYWTLDSLMSQRYGRELNLVYIIIVRGARPELAEHSSINIRGNRALVNQTFN